LPGAGTTGGRVKVAGVYEVVHVFVVRDDDVLKAAVTPRMVLPARYVNVDVELLGSAMGVAGDVAVFMAGSEERLGGKP
jgi:hypothetical protein